MGIDWDKALNRKYSNMERGTDIEQQNAYVNQQNANTQARHVGNQFALGKGRLELDSDIARPGIANQEMQNTFLSTGLSSLLSGRQGLGSISTAPVSVSDSNWNNFAANNKNPDGSYGIQTHKRGTAYVKDKTGKGSPKKDTVPAVLAEGEAVLNAGAAAILGRDKIAALNKEGVKKMGLRGGATMKDGVLHAATGTERVERIKAKDVRAALKDRQSMDQLLDKDKYVQARSDKLHQQSLKQAVATVPEVKAPANVPPKVSPAGVKPMLGPVANIAAYGFAPDSEKAEATAGFGMPLLGLAYQAKAPLLNYLSGLAGAKFSQATPAMTAGDAKLLARQTDAAVDKKAVPVPAGYIAPGPERFVADAAAAQTAADNNAYSEFFTRNGLSDAVRQNAPVQQMGVIRGSQQPTARTPGVTEMRSVEDPQGLRNKIYKQVDKNGNVSYTGMGNPSVRKAEADAEAADQPQRLQRGLMLAALGGSKEAAMILGNMMEQERAQATLANNLDVARIQAGAKGSGNSAKNDFSFSDRKSLATLQGGEDGEMAYIQAMNDRYGAKLAQFREAIAAESDPVKQAKLVEEWSKAKATLMSESGQIDAGNLLDVQKQLEANTQGERALNHGIVGGIGGALTFLAGAKFKNKNLMKYGLTGLGVGGGTGGAYGWSTGAEGVPVPANLDDLAYDNVHVNHDTNEIVSNDPRKGLRAPLSLLDEAAQARYLRGQ